MAPVASTPVSLGFKAPAFSLPEPKSGKILSLETLKSDIATVLIFMCNHCPYVKHVLQGIADISREYSSRGISFIGISSNDVDNYPEDSPRLMGKLAMDMNFVFPYLYDESQEVARAYDAACTPEFFIFDGDLNCVYKGQFDSSRPGNGIDVSGSDVRKALDNLITGEPVDPEQRASIGCSIKWKK